MSLRTQKPSKTLKSKRKRLDWILYALIIILGITLFFLLKPGLWRTLTGTAQPVDIPPSTVKTQLLNLPIRPANERAPEYRRTEFGEPWADVDNNGCNTRNDILGRDLTQVTYLKAKTPNCVVDTGVLEDPYTGQRINFKRGPQSSEDIQIDHVVALADAWRSGAHTWDIAKRTQFANDPDNLLAVAGVINEDKGRKTAEHWLPPFEKYKCAYVARQIQVKAKWGLSVTETERGAMIHVLANCPAMN